MPRTAAPGELGRAGAQERSMTWLQGHLVRKDTAEAGQIGTWAEELLLVRSKHNDLYPDSWRLNKNEEPRLPGNGGK